MNVIRYGISLIKDRIPHEVLYLAFMKKADLAGIRRTTIDDQIRRLVIEPIVLRDLNVISGNEIHVDLANCFQEHIQYDTINIYTVIKVPYELTGGREILQPLSITIPGGVNSSMGGYSTPAELAMTKVVSGVGGNTMGFHTTDLELIGPNVILMFQYVFIPAIGYLRVMVEHDKNLSKIKPPFFKVVGELMLYATQGYIYNELIVKMDKGELYGGHELSRIKDIVESYADAWEKYDEYLKSDAAQALFINDTVAYTRYLKSLIGPGL